MDQAVYRHPALAVRPCAFGWGVFALRDVPAGTVVERCPYLELPKAATLGNPLSDYVFEASADKSATNADARLLALGWGSLFNHDDDPNLEYTSFPNRRLMEFTAVREIRAGEQLFVSYGPSWWKTRGQPRAKLPKAR